MLISVLRQCCLKKDIIFFKHWLWEKMTMLCINIMRGPLFQFLFNNYLNPLLLTQKPCSLLTFLTHKQGPLPILLFSYIFSLFHQFVRSSSFLKNNCLCSYCSCNCVSRWFPTIVEDVMEFFNIIHSLEPMKKWNILKRIRKFYPILNFEYLGPHKQMIQTKNFKFSNKNIGLTLSNVIVKKKFNYGTCL
jgi:hypothetical protein